jgi:hypothetical protein
MASVVFGGRLVIVGSAATVPDRDVQHNPDDDHRGQERRPGQQDPMMGQVLDVLISHLRSFRGLYLVPIQVPAAAAATTSRLCRCTPLA